MSIPGQFTAVPLGFGAFGLWFERTFNLWRDRWQVWVLQALVLIVIVGVSSAIGEFLTFPYEKNDTAPPVSIALASFAFSILSSALQVFLTLGIVKTALKQLQGEEITVGDIFTAGRYFWSALLLGILTTLLALAGILACGVGLLLVPGIVFLALPILIDQQTSAIDALSRSWQTMRQNFWLFVLFALVIYLVSGLGVLACCVGIIATLTWYPIA
jgi:hypothetical protein